MNRSIPIAGALACLLWGCSATKPYVSDADDNLFITADTESGFLSGVNASLDIYGVRENCEASYLGTVPLGDAMVPVGVETGAPVQLVFNFESSSFLANSRTNMDYDVVLYPDFGQHYDIYVTYRDDIYNVEVTERPRGIDAGVPLTVRQETRDCQPQT